MFVGNQARTNIPIVDSTITAYLDYLAASEILPIGRYALAGGSMRAIFDKTRLRDLDIYYLGSETEHETVFGNLCFDYEGLSRFSTPFAAFKVANIGGKYIEETKRSEPTTRLIGEQTRPDVQIISYGYDSKFSSRDLTSNNHRKNNYVDTYASSIWEVINAFDLNLSRAGVEFSVNHAAISISEIVITSEFLIDVSMRKMRFYENEEKLPQQLTSLRRFHKLLKLGYEPDDAFFSEWNNRLRSNPTILEGSYD